MKKVPGVQGVGVKRVRCKRRLLQQVSGVKVAGCERCLVYRLVQKTVGVKSVWCKSV